MRKPIVLILTGVLVLGTLVAPSAVAQKAKKPKVFERVATYTYSKPDGVQVSGNGIGAGGGQEFTLNKGEKYVSVKSSDASGQPVDIQVAQDTNGDGNFTGGAAGTDPIVGVCGASDSPIMVDPKYSVWVFVSAGTCDDGTTSPATSGSVTLTFSNSPKQPLPSATTRP